MTKISKTEVSAELDKISNHFSTGVNIIRDNDQTLHFDELKGILEKCRINVTERIPEPETCLEIISKSSSTLIATLGNFSAIIGKAKSKKTFLISIAISSAIKNDTILDKFKCSLPERKQNILFFDTEQSEYHVQKVVMRICKLAEMSNPPNLHCFGLRSKDTQTRIKLIEYALETIEDVGLVVIDGIRDLVFDINNPEESTKIVTKLMQWTDNKGIHIMTALHQNKGDTNARGHLGTEIINKSETIISVTKDAKDPDISIVEAEYLREKEFAPFAFKIGLEGLPYVIHDWQPPKEGKKTLTPFDIPPESHHRILKEIFKRNKKLKYGEFWKEVKYFSQEYGMSFGDNKAKEFVTYYDNQGMVKRDGEDRNKFYILSIG